MTMTPLYLAEPPSGPHLGCRFRVNFLSGGIVPNNLDIRFQRVSGLSAGVETRTIEEGGQNLYSHRLPRRVRYENLVLERGFVIGSSLVTEVNFMLSTSKFHSSHVIVTLLGEAGSPLAAWLFLKTFPVRWSTSNLDASNPQILIDTLELAYTSMQPLRV